MHNMVDGKDGSFITWFSWSIGTTSRGRFILAWVNLKSDCPTWLSIMIVFWTIAWSMTLVNNKITTRTSITKHYVTSFSLSSTILDIKMLPTSWRWSQLQLYMCFPFIITSTNDNVFVSIISSKFDILELPCTSPASLHYWSHIYCGSHTPC